MKLAGLTHVETVQLSIAGQATGRHMIQFGDRRSNASGKDFHKPDRVFGGTAAVGETRHCQIVAGGPESNDQASRRSPQKWLTW